MTIHDAKPLIRALLRWDIDLAGLCLDPSLAAYLLDPSGNSYPLDELLGHPHGVSPCLAMTGLPMASSTSASQQLSAGVRTARVALATARVSPKLAAALEDDGLAALNNEVEVPLVRV